MALPHYDNILAYPEKNLPDTNAPTYFGPCSVKKKKELKTLTPGTYIINLCTPVFNNVVQ